MDEDVSALDFDRHRDNCLKCRSETNVEREQSEIRIKCSECGLEISNIGNSYILTGK